MAIYSQDRAISGILEIYRAEVDSTRLLHDEQWRLIENASRHALMFHRPVSLLSCKHGLGQIMVVATLWKFSIDFWCRETVHKVPFLRRLFLPTVLELLGPPTCLAYANLTC